MVLCSMEMSCEDWVFRNPFWAPSGSLAESWCLGVLTGCQWPYPAILVPWPSVHLCNRMATDTPRSRKPDRVAGLHRIFVIWNGKGLLACVVSSSHGVPNQLQEVTYNLPCHPEYSIGFSGPYLSVQELAQLGGLNMDRGPFGGCQWKLEALRARHSS